MEENTGNREITDEICSLIRKQALANPIYIYNDKPASNYLLTYITYFLRENLMPASDYLRIVEAQYNVLSEIQDIIENKKERKATTLLFLLENGLIYYSILGKLYPFPQTNQRSLYFLLQQLEKKGLIRELLKTEMINEKGLFKSVVKKSSAAGNTQANAIKFYKLTDLASIILPSFKKSLEKIANHLEDIKKFRRVIRETHKQRSKKAEREKIKKEEIIDKEEENKEILENIYGPYKDHILTLRASDIHFPENLRAVVQELQAKGCKARMDTLKTIWRQWHQEDANNREAWRNKYPCLQVTTIKTKSKPASNHHQNKV